MYWMILLFFLNGSFGIEDDNDRLKGPTGTQRPTEPHGTFVTNISPPVLAEDEAISRGTPMDLLEYLWPQTGSTYPDGWLDAGVAGLGCLHFSKTPTVQTWSGSWDYCREQGAKLVTIKDQGQLEFMRNLMRAVGEKDSTLRFIWIDGDDIATEDGVWKYEDGTAVPSFVWGSGQPDNFGGEEDCFNLHSVVDWMGNDGSCDDESPHTVCQKNIIDQSEVAEEGAVEKCNMILCEPTSITNFCTRGNSTEEPTTIEDLDEAIRGRCTKSLYDLCIRIICSTSAVIDDEGLTRPEFNNRVRRSLSKTSFGRCEPCNRRVYRTVYDS